MCVALLAAAEGHAAAEAREGPDLTEIASLIREQWDSLASLALQSEERMLDGDPHPGRIERHRFAYASGGRWALATDNELDGRRILEARDVREDGRKRYSLRMFPGAAGPDAIDAISIQQQQSTEDRYEGVMFRALWLYLPGGASPQVHLEEGARITEEPMDGGGRRIVLVTQHRGRSLTCELDPEHDWLPRRVVLEGEMEITATRFERDNGRWFPVEGEAVQEVPDGKRHSRFAVTNLKINRGPLSSAFQPPPSLLKEPGLLIVDATKGIRDIVGGRAARSERIRKYASPERPPSGPPITVPQQPSRVPWGRAAIGLSSALFIAAATIYVRRYLRS